MNSPCEKHESSKSSDSEYEIEVPCGSDDKNNSIHEHFGECRDDEADIEDDRRREMLKNYEKMKKRTGVLGKYVLRRSPLTVF